MPEETIIDSIRNIMNSATVFGYFLQVVPITAVVGVIYIICRILSKEKKNNEFIRFLFVCYITGLFNLVVMPADFWLHVFDGLLYGWWDSFGPVISLGYFNLVPSVVKWIMGELTTGSWVKKMLIGNLLMFMPLGFFLPFVTDKVNKNNIIKTAAVIPLAIEILQLFLGRSFDVDDLFCNAVGILIGFVLASVIRKKAGAASS